MDLIVVPNSKWVVCPNCDSQNIDIIKEHHLKGGATYKNIKCKDCNLKSEYGGDE